MKEIFFSIIIPTYNRSKRLKAAILSVTSQTFHNWELIIVDDGSTDDTADVVRSIPDNRIVYVFQENKERSSARNAGIKKSAGEYVCFLDSDDQYKSNHLSELKVAIEKSDKPDLLRTFTEFKNESTGEVRLQEIPEADSFVMKDAETHFVNISCNPTALCVKRSLAHAVGFDEKINLGEDFDFIIRLLTKKPRFCPVRINSVVMTDHEGNTQNQFTPQFHRHYINSLKSIVKRGLIKSDENRNTIKKRIAQRYRWMAEGYYLEGKRTKSLFYKIYSKL